MKYSLLLAGALIGLPNMVHAQRFVANYDEAKIPKYELPEVLRGEDGKVVTSAEQWQKSRRDELLELFTKEVYGRAPQPFEISYEVVSEKKDAIGGKARRREVDVYFGGSKSGISMRLLIYSPVGAKSSPAFLGLNFQGNHGIDPDPSISLNENWMRPKDGIKNNRATEASRGATANRWPVEMIIDRGYALVTIYYGDIDPDFDDGFQNGIHGQFASVTANIPQGEKWGSIAAWAYGLSRALDYLEKDPAVDGNRVAVLGHSRLGKTSLWAGATDSRFKMVISNNSGCGGAALSRRAIGETVERINTSFPHWFCDNYTKYNRKENDCPVDQHQLIALIAPRAVYVASATEDRWADPKGEFLSAAHADGVYRLLGTAGMGGSAAPKEMPVPDQPIKSGSIGYHLRTGKHDVTPFDWKQYLDFADQHLR